MRRITSYRANHTPAKQITIGNFVEELNKVNLYRKGTKTHKTTVSDICDKCLNYISVKRKQLPLRKFGFKFYHRDCYIKEFGNNTEFENLKKNKIILGYYIINNN